MTRARFVTLLLWITTLGHNAGGKPSDMGIFADQLRQDGHRLSQEAATGDGAYNLMSFGGYAGGYPESPTTTGSIRAGSPEITTTAAFDVMKGQYLTIYGAGKISSLSPVNGPYIVASIVVRLRVATIKLQNALPYIANGQYMHIEHSEDSSWNGSFPATNSALSVTPTFATNHADCNPCALGKSATLSVDVQARALGIVAAESAYRYKLVGEDINGGLSAASASVEVEGAARLGQRVFEVIKEGCQRDRNGLTTITTTTAHAIAPQSIVEITTADEDGSFGGQFTTIATPSPYSITFGQTGAGAKRGCTKPAQLRVMAKILLQWNHVFPNYDNGLKGVWIYRCSGAKCIDYSLVGHQDGTDGIFVDYGLGAPKAPAYVPMGAPPLKATAGYLSARVISGEGTNTLLLDRPAVTSSSNATVLHDNTPVVYAICRAMPGGKNGQGGVIYVPDSAQEVVPFTTSLVLIGNCPGNIELQLGARLAVTQPIIPNKTFKLVGLPNGGQPSALGPFAIGPQAQIMGSAYPLILEQGAQARGQRFENLNLQCAHRYQSCLDMDTSLAGGYGITFDNISFAGSPGSQAVRMGAAFHYYFDHVSFANNAIKPESWGVPEPLRFLLPGSIGFHQAAQAELTVFPSISQMNDITFVGGGMVFDSQFAFVGSSPQLWNFSQLLCESCRTPLIRMEILGGSGGLQQATISDLQYADYVGGPAVPMIDFTNSQSSYAIQIVNPSCATSLQPVVETNLNGVGISVTGKTCTIFGALSFSQPDVGLFHNLNLSATGRGTLNYPMSSPAAPTVALTAGPGPAPGAYFYSIFARDLYGATTLVSESSDVISVDGAHGVQLTWSPVSGQLSATVCRGISPDPTSHFCANSGQGFNVKGNTFTDTGNYYPAASPPVFTTAGETSIGAEGITTSKLNFVTNGQVESLTSVPREQQTVFLAGALTTTWIGSAWTTDKALTVTRVQLQAKTVPVGCETRAIVRVSDGVSQIDVPLIGVINDSGPVHLTFAAGTTVTVSVKQGATGCKVSPADVNAVVQYLTH